MINASNENKIISSDILDSLLSIVPVFFGNYLVVVKIVAQ
jgi:hypothetical protein